MNRHQILTGACNGGYCYAIGTVEGVVFIAYASGCDIVILASNFERVVTIPGVLRGSIKVSCVDCSTDTGKIAASYGRKIHIFEPTPSSTESNHHCTIKSKHETNKKLDYRWFPTAELDADCFVDCLSWNVEGSRLLTGGEYIQMWEFIHSAPPPSAVPQKVSFTLGVSHCDEDDPVTHRLVQAIADPDHINDHQTEPDPGSWECVWKIKPATPVTHLEYSPDSFVFASLGKNERLVKIWYEDQKVSQGLMRHDSVLSPKKNAVHYTFVYISHPRAVTGFEWRQTSKYMPRGSVANMLVTSCEDNVCRIFVETILPDAGLLDLEQFDPAMSSDSKYHTQRHKNRFVQRLKNLKVFHKRRKHTKLGSDGQMNGQTLQNSSSVHDFHKFAIHHNGVSPVLHFHLACSINPDTDIPLLPIVGNKEDVDNNFRLHWLNNKELEFTMEAEKLLQELHQKLLAEEKSQHQSSTPNQVLSDDEYDSDIEETDPGKKLRNKVLNKRGNLPKENGFSSHHSSFSSNEDLTKDEEHPPEFPIHLLQSGLGERLDRKIDALLLDWHSNPDYVFCIHPVDGSFLVWLIDHLDESTPFTFHQAQASFSSRLPRAFPIQDARSMANKLLIYCNFSKMDFKSLNKSSNTGIFNDPGGSQSKRMPLGLTSKTVLNMLVPNIHMVTKHNNGTLNQWQVTFAEKTKFQNIVSVSHSSRACGHRFRTNSAACHPVLPLMLTTSHHNLPGNDVYDEDISSKGLENISEADQTVPTFCSELILWQVVPVGPLSKSGGLTELCRINNSSPSAFTSVAWVPTLLPSSLFFSSYTNVSTCLGSYSNSPSTLFVASDGHCLRLFQAVIDARSLLMEKTSNTDTRLSASSEDASGSLEFPIGPKTVPSELFNVISLQSSTRPGCVLELDAISNALQDWQNIQLLHVYQEQIITGLDKKGSSEAVVDLSGQHTFDENFYLVVVEKNPEGGSNLHMWKITIDSKPAFEKNITDSSMEVQSDEISFDEINSKPNLSRSFSQQKMTMSVRTTKVCFQTLPLPEDVEVIAAAVSGGHLSSASIYPACYAPYQFATASSDGEVRFWRCNLSSTDKNSDASNTSTVTSYEFSMDECNVKVQPQVRSKQEEMRKDHLYDWSQWQLTTSSSNKSSSVTISGKPIAVSCAYSGRLAVAFRLGPIRTQPEHPENKFVNLRVVILECESTGGSEWIQEDTIELNNIKIPDPKNEIDMFMLHSFDSPQLQDLDHPSLQTAAAFLTRTKSVPSLSTIQSVRKSISEAGNKKGLLRQKCLVQLDWVSTEDGSHLLTVGVGSKVLIYGQVSYEIAKSLKSLDQQAEACKEDKRSAFANSKRLAVNKSMVAEDFQEEIKWMQLKGIELTTADGLPPLPMHISWVRAGILVVGMDNEMQVFTQWKPNSESMEVAEEESSADSRTLTEAKLVTAASSLNLCNNFKSKSNFKTSLSMSNFKHISSNVGPSNASKRDSVKRNNQPTSVNQARSESISSLPMLYDTGLFEAARFANPVLPQYHPKLLMELLNFGKTRRVKAILAHLVRCISGSDGVHSIYSEEHLDSGHLSLKISRQRSISVRSENDVGETEPSVNYVEIKSIPPLPLYALIAADKDNACIHTGTKGAHSAKDKDYSDILDVNIQKTEDNLDEQLLSTSSDSNDSTPHRPRLLSGGNKPPADPYSFTPAQASILREYLFKLNLPGLSGNDQFYLAALAEVVGSTTLDFQDTLEGETDNKEHQGSVDECGLRFLLAIRQYQCLVKTLPPIQRVSLLENGIRTFHLVWAFHSESTQELLSAIPCVKADEPVWEELKLYGVGWWLNNMTQLKALMVKVANTAFKKSKKPMDAAIYYLAMKKKTIVKSLFKTVQDSKMEAFFSQDFTNENHCRVAMKNAFHLLSKGQYQHAAALFFLAGQVDNAVNVILDKLEDLQLAIVLCRLYDDTLLPDTVRGLFYERILGLDKGGHNYQSKLANPDPFLRSMALWQFKDYESSLQTLLEKNIGKSYAQYHGDMDKLLQITRVFNFYNYLRTHPLITRLRLASSSLKQRTEVITGFTHTDTIVSDGLSTLDQITPSERQLFFATAHAHFQNGCPLVSIEVMRKLPKCPLLVEEDLQKMEYFANRRRQSLCEINSMTGTFQDLNIISSGHEPTIEKISTSLNNKTDSIDWGKPLLNSTSNTASSMDWGFSSHVHFKDDLDLDLDLGLGGSDDDEDDEDEDKDNVKKVDAESSFVLNQTSSIKEKSDDINQIDIMAQQYKFIACLKVLSEELGNLATGFEVDGGQLRHQLYIWLEKEVEVLRILCHYGSNIDSSAFPVPPENESILDDSHFDENNESFQKNARSLSMRSDISVGKASLYEVMKAEKQDLQSKVARMARRKAWLRSNQHLLRTLASYCILQGSGGGGLASVRMEILLLLQELQQERPQQQLLSPLPFPTTLPLLSASITSNRSVIADPIQYLQCSIQDLLQAIVEMPLPPGTQTDIGFVGTIRDLAVALSSCIYQSLCDSDSFNVDAAEVGLDGFINPEFSYPSSHLMAGVKRIRQRSLSSGEEVVNTAPAKWPGVSSLQLLLARERDEDAPKITVMLSESLIAVYMSLLISALSMFDPQMIYRLVANKLDVKTWAALFGGGNKTAVKIEKIIPKQIIKGSQDEISKQRMLYNLKAMSNAGVSPNLSNASPETKVPYKEKFIPPELSMVNYFMTKPFIASADTILDYDSDDSYASDKEDSSFEDDEDVDDTGSFKRQKTLNKKKLNTEHSDPNSFSWCLIRYAVTKSVINNLQIFFPQIGIELSELPNASPNLHAVLKILERWEEFFQSHLEMFGGAPEQYIPNVMTDISTSQGRSKLEALLQPDNSPFDSTRSTLPIKRLWFYLLQQDKLKDIFIRYVFRKQKESEDSEMASVRTSSSGYEQQVRDPMKIIHKEQDIITSFAINQANSNLITLSTQKEIVELDIGYILQPPVWLEDDNEYDIEILRNPNPGPENPEFLVVQTPMDTVQPTSGAQTPSTSYMPSPSSSQFNLQTGRGSTVARTHSKTITRRPVIGVRRIGSHPVLPHYLTGGADGAVKLWEWGHNQPLATLRQSGSFPKVTKVLFNAQGNKCCVSDVEGSIALWQVGLGSNHSKPIMGLHCHNKTTSDFQFVGSSSLIATAGQSSEHKNVCIWDTLLPPRSSLVHAFQCHEQGSPAVVYASRQHLLISGGRKGEICIFDLRQRVLKHTFQAHEAPIKCLAIDPDEDYFITGSADGDIKVWGLKIHELIFSFPMEHSKNTFFKNVGSTSGVAQVQVGPFNHLYSCGVDGSMKFRQLPERELVVHHWA